LFVQVAESIRAQIVCREWKGWIPSERSLSGMFHVGRNTCRHATAMLRREGLIVSVHGRGNQVVHAPVAGIAGAGSRKKSVGIIIPDRIGRLRPKILLIINELREELYEQDVLVEIHAGPAPYSRAPGRALSKLVAQHSHDCWVLFLSSYPLQKWFMQQGIPCLVSGAVYQGIRLPCVCLDYRAMCRHAVGKLIALGHRRLVFMNRGLRAAGDLESEMGFWEGVNSSAERDIDARIVYHDDNPDSVRKIIDRLFGTSRSPTGLLIANSLCYLAVVGLLASRGYQFPRDISLISRDNDRFLAFTQPEATRYMNATGAQVRKEMAMLRTLLTTGIAKCNTVRVLPRFFEGGTLGVCPADSSAVTQRRAG